MSVKRAFFGVFQKIMVICCAMFFGIANAFSANLPAGYTELEYIESTGTQYIDTGVALNAVDKVTGKVEFTALPSSTIAYIAGGRGVDSKAIGYALYTINHSGFTIYNAGWLDRGANISTGQVLEFETLMGNSQQSFVVNGNIVLTGNTSIGRYKNSNAIGLFGLGSEYKASAKMYSIKFYSGTTLVADFVSARRNSDNVLGMYDTVNNVFYTNAGTGEFTAGPVVPENPIKIATTAYNAARFNSVQTDLNNAVATIRDIVTNTINQTAAIASLQADKQTRPEDACPAGKKCLLVETEENGVIVPHWYEIIENIYGLPSGYTALEYIESTGTQYIDTGVKANLNTKAEGVFEIPSGDVGQLFGSYDAGAYFRFYVPASSLKANIFDGVGLQTSLLPGDVSRGTKIKITLDKTGLYVDSKTFAYNGTPSAFTATSNIYIGMISSYTGGTVSEGKVYSFKLYNNDAIVRDFVPAKRDSDSAIGMYDLADPNPATAFYTNSGTGTFTAGPEM